MQYVPQIIVFVVIWYQPILSISTRFTLLVHSASGAIPTNIMMTSSNENICRVTGPLCGEFTGHRWISQHKGQWHGTLMFSLICAWINGWVNNREAGDLIRHRAQYVWRHCNDGYECLRADNTIIRKQSTHSMWYILLTCIRPSLLANNVINILKLISAIQSSCASSTYLLRQPTCFQEIW